MINSSVGRWRDVFINRNLNLNKCDASKPTGQWLIISKNFTSKSVTGYLFRNWKRMTLVKIKTPPMILRLDIEFHFKFVDEC